jgi:hypothetical protein
MAQGIVKSFKYDFVTILTPDGKEVKAHKGHIISGRVEEGSIVSFEFDGHPKPFYGVKVRVIK